MSLKSQVLSGVKWSTLASFINSIVQIIQLAILARLLEPTDFGLIALVMVVIGFSQMFIDMGLSNAIIYKQKISIEQLSSLYWLNVLIGIMFFVLLIFSSPLIAKIYEDPKLTTLINIVAITFLIKPWGQQFMVLLQKNLQFNAIAIIDIISRFFSFLVIIILAYNDFGVYSLAIGSIVFSIISTIGYNYYGRNLYKPKLYMNVKQLKDFLSFGLFQMGEKIIQYFSTQFDTLLIGKLLGVEMLGVYNVAKNLVSKPSSIINPIVTKVTFPLMSKFNDDITQLKSVFLKMMNFLAYANFPVYLLIAVLAKPIIFLMFGKEWEEAIPIVQILSITFLLLSIGNPSGSLLLSRGKANIAFYWNLTLFIFYPLSIYIGSFWGIVGITWGTLILQLFLLYPNWKYIVNNACHAGFVEYFETLKFPFIVSSVGVFFPIIFLNVFNSHIALLVISCLVFAIIYVLLIYTMQPRIFFEFKKYISDSFSFKT